MPGRNNVYLHSTEEAANRKNAAQELLKNAPPLVVASIKNGILFVGESYNVLLRKTAEIYDKIAFGAIGKYAEFNSLRKEIIYLADTMGYRYARQDVTTERLVEHLAEQLQVAFNNFRQMPPMVAIILAEINEKPEHDKIFKVSFDGDITSHHPYIVVGYNAEKIDKKIKKLLGDKKMSDLKHGAAIVLIKEAIITSKDDSSEKTKLEISFLSRNKTGRCFYRLK